MHYAARLATEAAVEHLKIDAYRVAQPSSTVVPPPPPPALNFSWHLLRREMRRVQKVQPSVKSNKTSTFPGDRVSLSVEEGAGRRAEGGWRRAKRANAASLPVYHFTSLCRVCLSGPPGCALVACTTTSIARLPVARLPVALGCLGSPRYMLHVARSSVNWFARWPLCWVLTVAGAVRRVLFVEYASNCLHLSYPCSFDSGSLHCIAPRELGKFQVVLICIMAAWADISALRFCGSYRLLHSVIR